MQVLQHLRQPEAHGRLPGSWHELTRQDHVTYRLIHEIRGKAIIPRDTITLLYGHPAWDALSFINNGALPLHIGNACKVIASIVDPRWFWHADRPTRLNKLYAHFGLSMKAVRNYLKGDLERVSGLCRTAIETWYNLDRIGMAPKPAGPYAFIWRAYEAAVGDVAGILRATKRMLSFIYHVWLSELDEHPETLFYPDLFFKAPDEVRAYKEHVRI